MAEWLVVLLAVGGLLTPIILASMARDRTLVSMIAAGRDASEKAIQMASDLIHDRINRIRDDYVRRDDLQGHLVRIDKQFDDMRAHIQRGQETTEKKLDAIQSMLRKQ